MPDRELLLERLERLAIVLDEIMPRCAELVRDAIAMLKEQEKSIPISWLEEKLVNHPELSYAVTDGINAVLDLWGRSVK